MDTGTGAGVVGDARDGCRSATPVGVQAHRPDRRQRDPSNSAQRLPVSLSAPCCGSNSLFVPRPVTLQYLTQCLPVYPKDLGRLRLVSVDRCQHTAHVLGLHL